jgi:histidinol dehydrogenase
MPHELDKILISPSKRLVEIRSAVMQAATFDSDSDEGKQVLKIINKVRYEKDKAVAKFTKNYDYVELKPEQFRVSKEELKKAHKEIDYVLLTSLRRAIENVKKYQTEIFIGNKNTHPGIKYTPIKRIGICVPGASAPLPSTVIMTAVPAIVAGVKPEDIAIVSPPRYKPNPEAKGTIHPVTLAVCYELGINQVYRIGGAQAIAALAFGTETIPNVDKIVGPGNKWVQTAKKKVIGLAGIDSIAGPSEVLIIANDKANPAWVAADMLSQAEHVPGSAVVFTDSKKFAEKLLDELKSQIEKLDRSKKTIECLKELGLIVFFDDMDNVIKWANNYAMEHLEIQCGDESKDIAERIENAGAIFIGDYSPVAVGDYWAGPSHTLPTGTSARFFSALTSNDFIKSISIIEYDKKKLAESAEDIIRLAEAEGLDAHAKSVRIRQRS